MFLPSMSRFQPLILTMIRVELMLENPFEFGIGLKLRPLQGAVAVTVQKYETQ